MGSVWGLCGSMWGYVQVTSCSPHHDFSNVRELHPPLAPAISGEQARSPESENLGQTPNS